MKIDLSSLDIQVLKTILRNNREEVQHVVDKEDANTVRVPIVSAQVTLNVIDSILKDLTV